MTDDHRPLYHLALRLDGEACLVVGAGPVASRKAAALLECGAQVRIVAPEVSAAMEALVADHPPPGAVLERRVYRRGEVAGYRLAVAATGDRDVDRSVYVDARGAGVLVNAADDPASCSFLVPAVARAGDVSVAVSTGGASPFLAGWVRDRVAGVLGPEVAELAGLLGTARRAVRAAGVASESCDWAGLVEETLWPLLSKGENEAARKAATAWAETVVAGGHGAGARAGCGR